MRTILMAALGVFAGAAAAWAGVAPVGENMVLEPLGEGWKVGYQQTKGNVSIVEFVKGGETVQNWTELATINVIDATRNLDLKKYEGDVKASLESRCRAGAQVRVLSRAAVSTLPARLLTLECAKYPDGKAEANLQLAVAGKDAVYIFQRARKTARLDERTLEKWTKFLKKLHICDTRDPERPCGAAERIDARSENEKKRRTASGP